MAPGEQRASRLRHGFALLDRGAARREHHLVHAIGAPIHELRRGDGHVDLLQLGQAAFVGVHADHSIVHAANDDRLAQWVFVTEQLALDVQAYHGDLAA